MDERRVADYFVVAGLPQQAEPVDDLTRDGVHLKPSHNQAPITDVTVIFRGLGEEPPPGYTVIEATPTGFLADLNHGSLRSPDVYICYRRGRDKPPLVDIGVMYDGKERIMADAECVHTTPGGRVANINNSAAKIFVTYRRASPSMPCNELVVTDICVILTSKGEMPPHAFCMINKNLNKGMVGSDVFLCYKKSMNRASLISYKPGILARYPHHDLADFPFPPPVPLFCLPMGATIESWPWCAVQPRPVFSTFVLTVRDASEKLYGSAVTFYERLPRELLTAEQCRQLELAEDSTVNVNKCICLLSHWPFFDTFEKFLLFLYETASSGPLVVPIERYISHFLECVPFPSAQRPQILVQLSASSHIVLTQPEDLPLPRSGASFRELLMNLGADNCLMVLLLALTEQKLLVHSLRPDVLTAVAEAMSMVIFPFKWQCPYIPLCPLGLAEVLHAPLPFLIGVDSRFFDLYDPPTDVNCVDLDTNTITVCDEKRGLTLKLLPKKPARLLRTTLEHLSDKLHVLVQSVLQDLGRADTSVDRDFQLKRKEQALELEIQEAFLRFMATILKGYKAYLQPITKAPTIGTTDPSSLFDLHGFLRSRDKAHHKFFTLIMKTQMFIRFIEERSFVSNMDADLVFFDDCMEKVDNEEADTRLLELDESHHSEHTVFIAPPEPTGLPAGITYCYQTFSLNPVLFSRKELRHLVTSEGVKLSGVLQSSPLARRTKHEIRCAQKLARKYATSPDMWAKCLLSTCYSLWFLHLPSYALVSRSRATTCLLTAYELLVKTHKVKLQPADEVCYRVVMQLCGVYSQPVLAVKLLFHMKRCGIQPNAITYGFYNRAVLDSTWPSDLTNSGQLLWNKLRNVVMGVALFRRAAAKKRAADSSCTDRADVVSHTSVDSGNSHDPQQDVWEAKPHAEGRRHLGSHGNLTEELDFAAFDRYRSRHGSIVRQTGSSLLLPAPSMHQQSFESSAGLLMLHQHDRPVLWEEETDGFDAEEGPAVVDGPAAGRRVRHRSGSCSEFAFGLRGPHCPTSPKTGRSPDMSASGDNWKQLMRSESFANDARILDNLSRLKEVGCGLSRESVLANGQPDSSRESPTTSTTTAAAAANTTVHSSHRKAGINRALFGHKNDAQRRGSWTQHHAEEDLSSAGSTDDLDSVHASSKLFSVMQRWGGSSGKMAPDDHSTSPPSNKTSPVRTPVTENDPLGALQLDAQHPDNQSAFTREDDRSADMPEALDRPLLFGRGVSRSATFAAEQDPGRAAMHRSSTMPVDTSPNNNNNNNNNTGSSTGFKLPFSSRFSPARLSLRARELRASTHLIENAIANFSPGSLTSKKSNELLQGGLNSLKSAATSVARKFDEIKEAMSATSTPVKSNSIGRHADRESAHSESEAGESQSDSARRVSSEFSPLAVHMHLDYWGNNLLDLFGDGSRKGSASNLQPADSRASSQQQLFPENLYSRDASLRDPRAPVALEVLMTTCSKCHNCGCVLYDEEIMAGWVPEDSNLNTKCQFCGKATVPFLCVTVLDYRAQQMESVSTQRAPLGVSSSSSSLLDPDHPQLHISKEDVVDQPLALEPIIVPYLNPLVLRKELESILYSEGDVCLTQPCFVDEHPIIYWNMVWVFQRIDVVSHLPGLCLHASTVNRAHNVHASWHACDHNNVNVRCLWDNSLLHEEVGLPMYVLWQQDQPRSDLVNALLTDRMCVSRNVMQSVVSCVRGNDLQEPLRRLAVERQKLKGRGVSRGHSLYRDILFLAFAAMGRRNIDQAAFDREYVSAYERLSESDLKLYSDCDRPLSTAALCCRHYFRELEL